MLCKKVFALFLICGGVFFLFFRGDKNQEIYDGGAIVSIGKHRFVAEIADTEEERARGLSGRDEFAEGYGMLFLFDTPEVGHFWMKDMRFPIDIIWVREGKVIGVEERVLSPSSSLALSELPLYVSPGPVDMVFEVRAGTADILTISVGDAFSLN